MSEVIAINRREQREHYDRHNIFNTDTRPRLFPVPEQNTDEDADKSIFNDIFSARWSGQHQQRFILFRHYTQVSSDLNS